MFTNEKGAMMTQYVESKLNKKFFITLAVPEKRAKILRKTFIFAIRLFTFYLMILGIRLKK
jgi:hypothetical protein